MILTIGHSRIDFGAFAGLLRAHEVLLVLDIRSTPYSTRAPQFSQASLAESLHKYGMRYFHAGGVLGGRPSGKRWYEEGQVQYERIARAKLFRSALRDVIERSRAVRVALMCAEEDPIECHRFLLVARHLTLEGCTISHIRHDGTIESQRDAEARLLRATGLAQSDLFSDITEPLAKAYALQARRYAFSIVRSSRTMGENAE